MYNFLLLIINNLFVYNLIETIEPTNCLLIKSGLCNHKQWYIKTNHVYKSEYLTPI